MRPQAQGWDEGAQGWDEGAQKMRAGTRTHARGRARGTHAANSMRCGSIDGSSKDIKGRGIEDRTKEVEDMK